MAVRWHAAGVVIALGLFLIFAGPSLALISLFLSVGGQGATPLVETALPTVHVAGLLAGLLGSVLFLVGLVWWLGGLLRARRGT